MRTLLFIFSFCTFSLFANQPDSLKTKKWAIGLTYSPDYCYRIPYIKDGETGTTDFKNKAKLGKNPHLITTHQYPIVGKALMLLPCLKR